MSSSLEQLRATGTVVVCDIGSFASIDKNKPQDAITNPSLIVAAAKKPEYSDLIDTAFSYGKQKSGTIDDKAEATLDRVLVEFGREILKIIPGKVSTAVDAKLSFDTHLGLRGIRAARILQSQDSVNCNLTLTFSLVQAITAAEASAFLDWYKATHIREYSADEDPGIKSVRAIFNYYKKYEYKTIVIGASFRNIGQITELAGCDYLTIPPNLLEYLYRSTTAVSKQLDSASALASSTPKSQYINDKASFRFNFNKDSIAIEKLREGISKFVANAATLKNLLKARIET
ncbi:sedoheptulose-7-phosphate:D-glyceraldehyde-3-phosphate transaldolase [Penicillium ochrochloron]